MKAWAKIRVWIVRYFAIIGALVTAMFLAMYALVAVRATETSVPKKTILELDLGQPLEETTPNFAFPSLLGQRKTSVVDVVAALEKARNDARVSGLVAWLGDADHGMARTQEIRDAVAGFRKSGKFAIAYAETFGELGPGNQSYYLATAFDEVWMQETGSLGLTGIAATAQFLKGTFDLLGVRMQGGQRREYKNAYNAYTEEAFTAAHREATQALVDDFFGQIVRAIAEPRHMTELDVRALIDRGPFMAPEALKERLVNGLAYRDEFLATVRKRAGKGAQLLYLHKYLDRAGSPYQGKKKIALVYGVGAITRGHSSANPVFDSSTMGSATVAGALRAAIDDKDVRAIVFRIDSPGGSAVASDTIWREVVRARAARKPVIVSMGNAAASGGYYVACGANKIVAHPATITGSIGVLSVKPMIRDTLGKVGVSFDSVQSSKNAKMFSNLDEYSEEQQARLEVWLDWVYETFKGKVAKGRNLSAVQVEELAKGRVWSGERAKALGLVDELGGISTALRLAQAEAGLGKEAFSIEIFPRPDAPWERFLRDPDNSEDPNAASEVALSMERWSPVLQGLARVGLLAGDEGVLTAVPLEIQP